MSTSYGLRTPMTRGQAVKLAELASKAHWHAARRNFAKAHEYLGSASEVMAGVRPDSFGYARLALGLARCHKGGAGRLTGNTVILQALAMQNLARIEERLLAERREHGR